MPQVTQVKPAQRRKWLKAGFAVVAVLVLAVIGYVVWYNFGGPRTAAVVKQAEQLDSVGKYSEALTQLQAAQKWQVRKTDKAAILAELAATSYDLQQFKTSLDYYKQLNTLQPHNMSTLVTLGDVALQVGDKQTAISAYSEVIPLMEKGPKGPTTQNNIDDLKQTVKELQQ